MICPVCNYENAEEDSRTCPQCGYNAEENEIFDLPFREIESASRAITESGGDVSPEQAGVLYGNIVAGAEKAIEAAKSTISKSLYDIGSKISSENAEESDEYKAFSERFSAAGEMASKGLEIIRDALNKMTSPETAEEGGQQLEMGSSVLRQGFFLMQQSGLDLSGIGDRPPCPVDITEPSRSLEYVSNCLSSYISTGDVQDLKSAVRHLRDAEELLVSAIEEYEGVPMEAEGANMREFLDYGSGEGEEYDDEYDEGDDEGYDEEEDYGEPQTEESAGGPEPTAVPEDTASVSSGPLQSEASGEPEGQPGEGD